MSIDREPEKSGKTLQTVDRAFTFLEFVAGFDEPPTIRAVSEALGLNITTAYHLFNTLQARGYIERRPDSTLVIGGKITLLYGGYRAHNSVTRTIQTVVSALSSATNETAWFSILVGDAVIMQILVDSPQSVRVSGMFVGMNGNEHVRAGGKVVLAYADEAVRDSILDRSFGLAEGMSPSRDDLVSDLETIRQRGWSIDSQSQAGAISVGAPVFERDDRIYGAIGIIAPADRFERDEDMIVSAAVAAAAEATRAIQLG